MSLNPLLPQYFQKSSDAEASERVDMRKRDKVPVIAITRIYIGHNV